MATEISDSELHKTIVELIPRMDLETISVKEFIKILSKEHGGVNLSERRTFIKGVITNVIDGINERASSNNKIEANPKLISPSSSKINDKNSSNSREGAQIFEVTGDIDIDLVPESASTDPNARETNPGSTKTGLHTEKLISKPLKELLKVKGNYLSRLQITKKLWEIIKEEELQNPEDKRVVILNEEMRRCFGMRSFSSFSMNTFVSCHVYPFTPISSAINKLRARQDEKLKRKAYSIKHMVKNEKKQKRAKTEIRWPPHRLSKKMAEFIGKKFMPRQHITKELWKYIKEHNLQDEVDRRVINCDEILENLLGVKSLGMLSLASHIGKHLEEKVAKNLYYVDGNVKVEADFACNDDFSNKEV